MLSSFSSVAVGSLRSNTPCNNLLGKLFYVKWLHLREREWTDNYIHITAVEIGDGCKSDENDGSRRRIYAVGLLLRAMMLIIAIREKRRTR